MTVKPKHPMPQLLITLTGIGTFCCLLNGAVHVVAPPELSWQVLIRSGVQTDFQDHPASCLDPARQVLVPCPTVASLVQAARRADVNTVEQLTSKTTDPKILSDALFAAATSAPGCPKCNGTQKNGAISELLARIAMLLLDKAAKIEARDQSGATPLIAAAGHGEVELVKVLLDKGADLEARDKMV